MDANNVVKAEISVYLLFYSILLSRRVKNHVIWKMPKDYDFCCKILHSTSTRVTYSDPHKSAFTHTNLLNGYFLLTRAAPYAGSTCYSEQALT